MDTITSSAAVSFRRLFIRFAGAGNVAVIENAGSDGSVPAKRTIVPTISDH